MSSERSNKSRRSLANLLLQPFLQVKLGVYFMILTLSFSVILIYFAFEKLSKIFELVVELTGAEAEVITLLVDNILDIRIQMVSLTLVYLILILIVSVIYTHKMVGPTIAFRRHIEMLLQKNYSYRTTLRTRDAFQEVAQDLNRLSEQLEKDPAK